MVEQLVCMQAQEPPNPYLALWSRLEDFDPAELSGLIEERRAVRSWLMRGTIHLASGRDCLRIWPLVREVLAKHFQAGYARRLAGTDLSEVIAAGLELLAEEPRTRSELGRALAPRWPDADPRALASAVTFNAPLVQVPPRGLWRARGQAALAPAEGWLGGELERAPSADDLVLRYLAAFGPATVADIRIWSRVTGLREVVERLRPRLRTFRDDQGRELFDVPDGPLPDPETPAPPRFLPEFDNVTLSHDDRSRMGDARPELVRPAGGTIGTVLHDGFHLGGWRLTVGGDTATLTIAAEPPAGSDELEAEGLRLLAFLAPDAGGYEVRFA